MSKPDAVRIGYSLSGRGAGGARLHHAHMTDLVYKHFDGTLTLVINGVDFSLTDEGGSQVFGDAISLYDGCRQLLHRKDVTVDWPETAECIFLRLEGEIVQVSANYSDLGASVGYKALRAAAADHLVAVIRDLIVRYPGLRSNAALRGLPAEVVSRI
jgi:hypothetical protein